MNAPNYVLPTPQESPWRRLNQNQILRALEIRDFMSMAAQGGIPQRSGFLSAFYGLVPLHGLHVASGCLWLIVLGIQLASTREMAGGRAIAGVVVIRLIVSSMVAYGLVRLLQFDDLTSDVLIVVAGMPTAVMTIILATQYRGKPELASGIVVVSTLASLISVTVVLTLLGAAA